MSVDEIVAYESIITELHERYLKTPKQSEQLIEYIKGNYESEVIPKIIYMIENHMLLGVFCQKTSQSIKIIIRLGELTEIKPQYNAVIERSFKLKDTKKGGTPTRTIDPIFKLIRSKYNIVPQQYEYSYQGRDHIDILLK